MLKNYAFLCDKNTKEYNNLIKIHTHERLIKKSGIDINLGRSCNLGCMYFYRQCKQQRDSGHQRCFNCNRIDFLHSYQQENCGLIPRKRNKKRRLHCNRLFLFSIVRSRIPIRTRLPELSVYIPFHEY